MIQYVLSMRQIPKMHWQCTVTQNASLPSAGKYVLQIVVFSSREKKRIFKPCYPVFSQIYQPAKYWPVSVKRTIAINSLFLFDNYFFYRTEGVQKEAILEH